MGDLMLLDSKRLHSLINGTGFYTYILLGSDGTYYTGLTGDIIRRLKEHDRGKSKSTRRKLPVEMMYLIVSETRKEARRLEVKIKNRGASRYINSRLKGNSSAESTEWIK